MDESPATYAEQRAFAVSGVMNDTLRSVSARLGFDGNRTDDEEEEVLGFEDVMLLFDICRCALSQRKYFFSFLKLAPFKGTEWRSTPASPLPGALPLTRRS